MAHSLSYGWTRPFQLQKRKINGKLSNVFSKVSLHLFPIQCKILDFCRELLTSVFAKKSQECTILMFWRWYSNTRRHWLFAVPIPDDSWHFENLKDVTKDDKISKLSTERIPLQIDFKCYQIDQLPARIAQAIILEQKFDDIWILKWIWMLSRTNCIHLSIVELLGLKSEQETTGKHWKSHRFYCYYLRPWRWNGEFFISEIEILKLQVFLSIAPWIS